jgi:hypothetical protein
VGCRLKIVSSHMKKSIVVNIAYTYGSCTLRSHSAAAEKVYERSVFLEPLRRDTHSKLSHVDFSGFSGKSLTNDTGLCGHLAILAKKESLYSVYWRDKPRVSKSAKLL